MPDWRARLRRELAGLDVPPERLRDLVEELALDLEARAESARAAGADEAEADAAAWRGLGPPAELRERLRPLEAGSATRRERLEAAAARGAPPWRGLGSDLRHAVRSLRRSPGFAAVALLTLALGIGANTTLFSVVDALFLAPLPVSDPESLVMVYTSDYSGPRYGSSSYPDFEDLRDQPELFASLAAYTFEAVALTTDREPARVWAELVTGDYFPTLGIEMALGRSLEPADDRDGAPPAVVISHGLWQRRLAGSTDALGRTVTLSGVSFTIVGVAPPGFGGLMRGVVAEAWLPLSLRGRLVPEGDLRMRRGSRGLSLVGRLAPTVGLAEAAARCDVLAEQLRREHPDEWIDLAGRTRRLSLLPEEQARVLPHARGALIGFAALLGLVCGLVLLIACANVANLMLARTSTRGREIAVRLALGASRARLVRHLLAESLAITLLGGALGVLLTLWATRALRALSLPLPVPVYLDVRVDWRVLLFALALAVVTGVLLGLAPALQAARSDLVPAFKDDAAAVPGPRGRRLRRAFVAAQVALSMVLLVGAALLLRGLDRATRISPGFEIDATRLIPVDLGLAGYDAARAATLIERLAQRARDLPGVDAAGLVVTLPLDLHVSRRGTLPEGYVRQPGEETEVYFAVVGPEHFEAFGIPILRGRGFTPTDREDAPGVAIVNETFAKRYWPGRDPIGRALRVRGEDGPRITVVGLARDSKYRTLAEEPLPFYYLPVTQDFDYVRRYARLFPLHVVVRGEGVAPAGAVAAALREIDPALPTSPPRPMLEHLGVSVLPSRVASSAFAAFGLLGLLLATLGVYGVVAYSVAQRTREIGLRVALGASGRDVLALVLRDGLSLAAVGLGIGIVLAAASSRGLTSLLYGLSPLDPVSFLLVPLLLGGVALVASALPARRAARVDPTTALRYE